MNKKNNQLIYIITTILILTSQIPIVSAADFEIINTDYTVDESRSNENTQYYTINITIKNTKTTPSEELTVELLDEWDLPTRKTDSFQSQETKTFTFEDIPFAGGSTHQVTVIYYPTNETLRTPDNQGSTTFNISYNSATTYDSPFLHPILLISIILLATIIIKKKKQ
jgi:hypothetical protein